MNEPAETTWSPVDFLRATLREPPSRSRMLDVCRKHVREDLGSVFPEPYIPYLPATWNGLLVLAEAQNLSASNRGYVDELRARRAAHPEALLTRLGGEEGVGVGPWDDGVLKLAVEAALGVDAAQTAVSNAVPWSRLETPSRNIGPDKDVEAFAVEFWKELLPIIAPSEIVTAGKVAKLVIRRALPKSQRGRQVWWRLPSPNMLSRVSGMFDRSDLLSRYPEVAEVLVRQPDWGPRLNDVFYACHAVSLNRRAPEAPAPVDWPA